LVANLFSTIADSHHHCIHPGPELHVGLHHGVPGCNPLLHLIHQAAEIVVKSTVRSGFRNAQHKIAQTMILEGARRTLCLRISCFTALGGLQNCYRGRKWIRAPSPKSTLFKIGSRANINKQFF
jgi:hypothetical protein